MKRLVSILMLFCSLAFLSFAQSKAPLTETQKIEALIKAVEQLKDAKFYRNGDLHDAAAAAKHLRMKWEKAGSRVKTAIDFIEKIASKSSMSGEPYKIVYANGKSVLARQFFYEKLISLGK